MIKKRKLRFWWVDDQPDDVKTFKNRLTRPSVRPFDGKESATLEIIPFKDDKDQTPATVVLKRFIDASDDLPDLVIVDQQLRVPKKDDMIIRRGSSLAPALRERFPAVPMVGVTHDKQNTVTELQQSQFIEFYDRAEMATESRVPELYSIAAGFKSIVGVVGLTETKIRGQLLQLLACPAEDAELLWTCLPDQFKTRWELDTPHLFARWLWSELLTRPGFLYDDLYVATLLGLSPEGFRALEAKLEACQYSGVLMCSTSTRKRWWVSEVRTKVRKLAKAVGHEPLTDLGRVLMNSNKAAFQSAAYGAGRKGMIPDVVAFKDRTFKKREQVIIADTEPTEANVPFGFEPYRVIKPHGKG